VKRIWTSSLALSVVLALCAVLGAGYKWS